MESLGEVTCERCGTTHEIIKLDEELGLKHKSNVNFQRGRKYVVSCTKCRALLYIGDKL